MMTSNFWFESGRLFHESGGSRHYDMRLMDEEFFPDMRRLRDLIESRLHDRELFMPTPDDIIRKGLGAKGMTCGVIAGRRLVGLRSIHFPEQLDPENVGRIAGIPYEDLDKVVELKLSLVDPAYRGNNLQSRMTSHLLHIVRERFALVRHSCAIVSPRNIPSLADKFAQNMTLNKLLLVNEQYWRCVFVGDLRGKSLAPIKSIVKIVNSDIGAQLDLLDRGYKGYGLHKSNNECRIVYAR